MVAKENPKLRLKADDEAIELRLAVQLVHSILFSRIDCDCVVSRKAVEEWSHLHISSNAPI